MSSISRTYRPQTFADVTDQDPIKETLRLEVESGKLGNAYLFAGPRGVGKTTLTRVFAKALNCLKPVKGEPCNACTACVEFNAGKCIDYIEMDAASNTGVDNVRENIVEHVRFAPSGHAYKIYSLDEAHMLSTSAWNALLKTIEEPPPYAKFIFITTELHKVPATIQSRCQRYDFKRVPQDALEGRIRAIAAQEGVEIDDLVIQTIAAKADGCVRDAEIFLGQLISLGEIRITTDVASLVLPVSRLPIAAQVLTLWSQRALGPSLEQIATFDEQGIPLLTLFDDLIEATRQLLLAGESAAWKTKLANGDEGERAVAALTGVFGPEELSRIALLLMERRRDAKQGADVRLCIELAATAVTLGIISSAPMITQPFVPPISPVTSTPRPASDPVLSQTKTSGTLTLGMVQSKWPAFLRALDEKSKSLTFVMKLVQPISVSGETVTLQFQYPFHRDKALNDIKTKRMIEDILRELTNEPKLLTEGVIGKPQEGAAAVTHENNVSTIMKAFGGKIVEEPGAVA